MGQGLSKKDERKVEDELEDRDTFCAKFAQVVRAICLTPDERTSLKALFEYFAIGSGAESYWTEAMFREFLSGALPSDVASILDATPLLFSWVLRVGSYPYHNFPRLTTRLTYDVLSTAMVICLGRYRFRQIWSEVGLAYDDVYTSTSQKVRRVLFQGLVENSFHPVIEQRKNDDDEDLIEAALLLSYVDGEARIASDEGYSSSTMKHHSLPCTDSRRLDGKISEADLRSWLRLLVATQRVEENGRPSLTAVADWKNLEIVTDAMLSAFLNQDSDIYTFGIGWTAFDSVIEKAMPNLLSSFQTLFTPFLKSDIINTSTSISMKPLPPLPHNQPARKSSRFSLTPSRRRHTSKTSISSLSSISSIFSYASTHSSTSAQSSASIRSTPTPILCASPMPISPLSPLSPTAIAPTATKLTNTNTNTLMLSSLVTSKRILDHTLLFQLSCSLPIPAAHTTLNPTALFSGVPESFTPEVYQRVLAHWQRPAVLLVSEECNHTPMAVRSSSRRVWGCFFPSKTRAWSSDARSSSSSSSNSNSNFSSSPNANVNAKSAFSPGREDGAIEAIETETSQRAYIFQCTPRHQLWRSRAVKDRQSEQFALGEKMTGRKRPRLELGLVEDDEGRVRLVLSDCLRVGCLTRTSGNAASGGAGSVMQDNFGVDWLEVWGF